jgi:undecaprenyl-diphosphatase
MIVGGLIAQRSPNPAARLGRAWIVAYVVLVAALVGAGHAVAGGGLGDWDRVGVNRWFASGRTDLLDTASAWGSRLAETLTVVTIGAVVVGVLAWRRRWPAAGVIVFGLALEVTVFLTATALVDRARPAVDRLDAAPPTSSFPSGHTAAAVVLYGGLAVLCSTSIRRRVVRVIAAAALVAVPLLVALARLYRGMHHPSDVIGGLLLGAACLTIAVVAVRRATEAFAVGAHRDPAPVGAELDRLEVTS